jgi:hypothetical protein
VPRLRPYSQIAPARPAWPILRQWCGTCHSLQQASKYPTSSRAFG